MNKHDDDDDDEKVSEDVEGVKSRNVMKDNVEGGN